MRGSFYRCRLDVLDQIWDVGVEQELPWHEAALQCFPSAELPKLIGAYCSHATQLLGPTKLQVGPEAR